MEPLLKVLDLKTEFQTPAGVVRAVDGINLTLYPGETLGIVGESGCGKSVTSLSIMGLLAKGQSRVSAQEIKFDGKNLLAMTETQLQQIRGNQMAMIFQEPMTSLNPVFKIGNQIAEALQFHLKLKKREAWQKVVELLGLVGIPRPEAIAKQYPHELSGGMRQRVMIAMAMACNPSVLIADEPTTALDVTIQAQILNLMRKLQEEKGTAILLITHDLGVIAEMCKRVIVMYAGQIVEEAEVRELFNKPKHPYTKGLLASLPRLDGSRDRLESIPGQVPNPLNMPQGCRFAPRCALKMERCDQLKPELADLGQQHYCRCLLCQEEDS
ncbi:ABC transporter ATP-binding protein [Desulfosporosinus sp. PR]|uniref:ABC transporter ATP-binding protein n=1 Tax=Candidatus Desulfosporosinus nitrosoreducens TaxID=3401928 RepID=UPI0027E6EDFD|nr:ABC transporter ATP-binding protein [Desulfosporosinus sp. PR]MDQ7096389.1 ABC transporter ATP-binding protein [Desulfosporosinus sp. PR]